MLHFDIQLYNLYIYHYYFCNFISVWLFIYIFIFIRGFIHSVHVNEYYIKRLPHKISLKKYLRNASVEFVRDYETINKIKRSLK